MFRALISLLIACVLTFTGMTAPAYAEGNYVGGVSLGAKQSFDSHDIIIVNSPITSPNPSIWEQLGESIKNGAIGTVGVVIGGAAVCYALDGAAMTVFPPAAALLPYCPAIGTTFAGGHIVKSGVEAVAKAL